ncbi:unnamed protein product [Rangifer tarandus platyrhynchus]|uniref:Uncharacterized protein n=2 Tax=Rangifer tarandus platyrhynchus TaxID=3082113 RepID=A0AC59ZW90_RANTA|nr:unnamed protein product [Rangifer tarandus platyrhynchus]
MSPRLKATMAFHCCFWVPSNASAEVFKHHLLGSFQAFHVQCLIYCNLSKHNSVRSCLLFAAAAESLQSCPTLCDPIGGSPPGSPVPGVLQARTLEWAAISFSNA